MTFYHKCSKGGVFQGHDLKIKSVNECSGCNCNKEGYCYAVLSEARALENITFSDVKD
jgi:hypothetical protein